MDKKEWLKWRLKQIGKNQGDLAKHLGIRDAAITEIIKDDRELSAKEATKVADFFQCDLYEVIQVLVQKGGASEKYRGNSFMHNTHTPVSHKLEEKQFSLPHTASIDAYKIAEKVLAERGIVSIEKATLLADVACKLAIKIESPVMNEYLVLYAISLEDKGLL